MKKVKLKKCRCGSHPGMDTGPQLFSTNAHYHDCPSESYIIEYEIRCLDCGMNVCSEYIEEVVFIWNGHK